MALQPLGTEGQYVAGGGYAKPYALWQAVVPVGGGIKYRFHCNWGVKLEAVYHVIFTDYLDDVINNLAILSDNIETGLYEFGEIEKYSNELVCFA